MTEQYQAAISKVWKEALSTEEKLRLLEALTSDGAIWKTELQIQFEKDVDTAAQYLPANRSEAILQQLHEQIRLMDEAATGISADTKLVSMRPRMIRWAVGIAAAVLVLAGFFWYPSKKANTINETLALYKPVQEYQCRINETQVPQTFKLQDGSEVRLAAGSSIVLVDGFTASARSIRLSGEAWFDVAKDNRRPFSVTAGGITTTALGTKFSVRPMKNSKLAVQLFEGKVRIDAAPGAPKISPVFLEPGQQFIVDAKMHTTVSSMATTEPAAKSAQSQSAISNSIKRIRSLEFVQTPLVEVLNQLGNRYHVHFKYDAIELSNDQVTGTFPSSDELSVALKLLRTINNLSFSQYQDTILVSKLK